MNRYRLHLAPILLALAVTAFAAPPAAAQNDSTSISWWRRVPEDHSPKGALWRAAVAPGWGQIYNRQFLKLPFVYAGLGGVAATALILNNEYLLFRRAHLYAIYADDPDPDPAFCTCFEDEYLEITQRYGEVDPATLRAIRDKYRRNRDLSYFGIGLVYGLTVLDAYVAAHLLHFDVGEDLTVSMQPVPNGVTARLRWNR